MYACMCVCLLFVPPLASALPLRSSVSSKLEPHDAVPPDTWRPDTVPTDSVLLKTVPPAAGLPDTMPSDPASPDVKCPAPVPPLDTSDVGAQSSSSVAALVARFEGRTSGVSSSQRPHVGNMNQPSDQCIASAMPPSQG